MPTPPLPKQIVHVSKRIEPKLTEYPKNITRIQTRLPKRLSTKSHSSTKTTTTKQPDSFSQPTAEQLTPDMTADTTITQQREASPPLPASPHNNTRNKIKITEFGSHDEGPYKIFIQNRDDSSRKIDAVLIGRKLVQIFKDRAKFTEGKNIAPNKVKLSIGTRELANEVLKLSLWNNLNLIAFIPNQAVTVQGILKGVSTEISEEEIRENLETPSWYNPLQIIDVIRFSKASYDTQTNNKTLQPTPVVQITIRGQRLPSHVLLFRTRYIVEQYTPLVRQCNRCYNFGHVKKFCKASRATCRRCGTHEEGSENPCPLVDKPPLCLLCGGEHLPTDKICAKRIEQQSIMNLASKNNLTVMELKNEYRTYRRSINDFEANFSTLQSTGSRNHNISLESDIPTHILDTYSNIVSNFKATRLRNNLNNSEETMSNTGSNQLIEEIEGCDQCPTIASQAHSTNKKQQQKDRIRTIYNPSGYPQNHIDLLYLPYGRNKTPHPITTHWETESESNRKNEVENSVTQLEKIIEEGSTLDSLLKAINIIIKKSTSTPENSAYMHNKKDSQPESQLSLANKKESASPLETQERKEPQTEYLQK
ncbi:hypothetical protein QAD02_002814 [Eretmocerus hayati]|uniref:Uncharacterized protein n=1 Tax=Eretmocerus hayati TaxID=131215 RepID=A0ACC2NK50_9HYME|nr:hypothetical protein QAD02_002814 [Eretmocerus hayati]